MRFRLLLLFVAWISLAGCRTGAFPDPNDPAQAGVLAPEVLRQNLTSISDNLNERLAKHEIDRQQYQQLIEMAAQDLLKKVKIERVNPSQAWEYVEVLRTAGRWQDAVRFAKLAVQDAQRTKNPDRLVNDTLRLAQALAQTGRVEEAIATARTVYDAGPTDSGPILLATLYEIVPAAQNKGHDVELAKLLEDAIARQMRTRVDPMEEHGKMFLAARPTHVRKAWQAIVDLYDEAHRPELARQAVARGQRMLSQLARV